MKFCCRQQCFDLSNKVWVMGIVNVTPDSFSEQGENYDPDQAVSAALEMIASGADSIDIGGESSRPGAKAVSTDEECRRILPVIERLRKQTTLPISIDTRKAAVAQAALERGADMINDISGFRFDPSMKTVAKAFDAGCIIMHMRDTPETMQNFVEYDDIIKTVHSYFVEGIAILEEAGIGLERIILDPGIGFSKTVSQNLLLLNRLHAFLDHERPLLVGVSRKSFIGEVLNIDKAKERLLGTAAAVSCAILRGAKIVRVHDVAEMKQVSEMIRNILQEKTDDN